MHQHATADLYLRLSLVREGKTAIDRQEADCRAWAERNGLTVRKVHIDRGRSGYKNVSRKGFDAAITAATAGVVGVLVVWKLDRLSRKGIGEVGKALDDIGRAGGRLVSVMDGLDTRNDSARITIAMLAELARNESRNLGMRVGSAKRYLRQRGQWIGGQPPYGLLVDPETKKLVHDPETLETVSIGEGIITVGERELILRQLEARTFPLAGKRHGHKQGKSLLTGIARCGLCGARMSKAGTSYQCSSHRMGRGCSGVSARVESIDDYVTQAFLSRLPFLEPQDPLLAVIADRWAQREDPEVFAKRDAIEAEIVEEESRLADLEEARYVRGEFTGADAIDRYNRLAGRLRTRVEGLRADLLRMPTPSVDISPLLDAGLLREAWEADDAAGRRERLGLAIDRVEVRRGRVGVRFNGDERCRIVWATRDETGAESTGDEVTE